MKRVITGLSLLLLLLYGASAQGLSQYECWTDDDYASREVGSADGDELSLTVSTAELAAGIHYLNFRARRDDGTWGNPYRYLYYIPTLSTTTTEGMKVEYWLDDELSGMRRETPTAGEASLIIDISTLTPGTHYFNCMPINSAGDRGNSDRYLFYVPQSFELLETAPLKGYEYWIDDNFAAKQVEQMGAQQPVLTVGIEELPSGVHYFNCRAFNERGEYGNPIREMFYIPDANTFNDATLASYEYWIDDDYAHCVKGSSANAGQAFTVDVSQLTAGVHYFNYLPIDNHGNRGNVVRQIFYKACGTADAACYNIEYEYWIDDDTSQKVKGSSSTGNMVFNIDVQELKGGMHTFNFKAKDALDQWGAVHTETFEVGIVTYKLIYMVDGVEYKVSELEKGDIIVPEAEPTKEGHTFSGWGEIPSTMPAEDVTVTGTFSVNTYKLTYMVDGEVFKTFEVEYGSVITPEAEPTKEGHTFSGWGEIPSTMPAEDVTVTGTFSVNTYKLTYMVDGEIYKETTYEYGAAITPEPQPEGDYQNYEWIDLPETMPAHDVVIRANFTTGITGGLMAARHKERIYSTDGKRLAKRQRGLNIVVSESGTIKKVVKK